MRFFVLYWIWFVGFWIGKVGVEKSGTMSEVFDGYERQYCELSAILSRQCTAASALDGGNVFSLFKVVNHFWDYCDYEKKYI